MGPIGNDRNQHHDVELEAPMIPHGRLVPFLVVTPLFFLWAIPNNLTDFLIRQFMKSFEINRSGAAELQIGIFIGYFLMAVPAGQIMRIFGYKAGLLTGLCFSEPDAGSSCPPPAPISTPSSSPPSSSLAAASRSLKPAPTPSSPSSAPPPPANAASIFPRPSIHSDPSPPASSEPSSSFPASSSPAPKPPPAAPPEPCRPTSTPKPCA